MNKGNKEKQYFRFFCKAIPSSSLVDGSKTSDEQDIYIQTSKDELEQFDLVGLPFFINHTSNVEVKKEGNDHKIIYPKNKHAVGYVVFKTVSDEGSLLTLVEIPPLDPELEGTPKGIITKAVRQAAISLIDSGATNGVSFGHYPKSEYDVETDLEIINKYPIELSMTESPLREGSSILTSYFSDEPYHLDNSIIKNFDVYKNMSTSALDKAAQERNRQLDADYKMQQQQIEDDKNKLIQEKNQEVIVNNNSNNNIDNTEIVIEDNMATNNNNNNNNTAGMPPSSGSNIDYVAVLRENERMKKENETLKRENDEYKPIYDTYTKEQQQQREQRKQTMINNSKEITDNAQNLLDFLLKMDQDKQISIEPADRAVFEQLKTELPKQKEQTAEAMSNVLLEEKRFTPLSSSSTSTSSSTSAAGSGAPGSMQTGGFDPKQLFNSFDQAFSGMAPTISCFHVASKYINDAIQKASAVQSDQRRNEAKASIVNSNTAATAQAPVPKKEPDFLTHAEMKKRHEERLKSMQADPEEVKLLNQRMNGGY